ARAARGARARVAWNAAGARLRDGARHAFPARRRSRPLRRRPRTRRHDRRLPPLRDLPPRQSAVALVDAAAAHDAEWLQRVARLRRDRVGARPRLRPRVAELRAVRGAARAGGGAVAPAAPRAACAAAAQGPFPARQPAALQPEVLPDVAAPLCRLREAARPAARRDRRACRRGVPPVRQAGADVTWSIAGGLVLALASAAALNWGYYAQQRAAAALPPLSLRPPMRSLAALFGSRRWLLGFWTGIAGWVLYVVALTLAPLSLVQACAAGGLAILAALAGVRSRRERLAVATSVAGLALLAVSLAG